MQEVEDRLNLQEYNPRRMNIRVAHILGVIAATRMTVNTPESSLF
jgi:hypothetical protein